MKRFLSIACVVAALAVAGTSRAQTLSAPRYVFTAIDSVLLQGGSSLYLSGVLEGASAPTQVQLYSFIDPPVSLPSCERYALLVMNKPGQYKLEVWVASSHAYCRLSRVNP